MLSGFADCYRTFFQVRFSGNAIHRPPVDRGVLFAHLDGLGDRCFRCSRIDAHTTDLHFAFAHFERLARIANACRSAVTSFEV
jgi:hypothetical protein